MQRYALFAWSEWEASGGWNDLIGTYDSLEAAKENIPVHKYGKTESQIIDLTTGKEYA